MFILIESNTLYDGNYKMNSEKGGMESIQPRLQKAFSSNREGFCECAKTKRKNNSFRE